MLGTGYALRFEGEPPRSLAIDQRSVAERRSCRRTRRFTEGDPDGNGADADDSIEGRTPREAQPPTHTTKNGTTERASPGAWY